MILDNVTMEQCLLMYENLDTLLIEDGLITEIIKGEAQDSNETVSQPSKPIR